jgi:hypothetical protein
MVGEVPLDEHPSSSLLCRIGLVEIVGSLLNIGLVRDNDLV